MFFPEVYETLINTLPDSALPPNDDKLLRLMQSEVRNDREKYTKIASRYEYKACGLNISEESLNEYYGSEDKMAEIYTEALLTHYYASNKCFLEEDQLLRDVNRIQNIPAIIINGRYDMVRPPVTAYELHKNLPLSRLIIVEEAGHLMSEKPIEKELLKAMRDFE